MNYKLDGKTVLICGGSSGIGFAIASALNAHKNIKLILVSNNEKKLSKAQNNLNNLNQVETIKTDLNDEQSVLSLIKKLDKDKIKIDILINNSGGPKAGDIFNINIDDIKSSFQLNFLSHVMLSKYVLDHMINHGWGRIINITSTLANEPTPGMIISSSIRASVSAFSKSLADTVADRGISVNTICPGGVETDRLKNLIEDQSKITGKPYEQLIKESTLSIPKKRFATPEELASLAEYLCCEEAGYITGRVIAFDGGLSKAY